MRRGAALRQGFRSVYASPALLLLEIGWRWCFGLFVLIALALAAIYYLRSTPVPDVVVRELRSMNPQLMANGMTSILFASWPLLLRLVAVLVSVLIVGWALLATAGRSVVLRRNREFPCSPGFLANFGLHSLRAIISAFAALAFLIVTVAAGFAGMALSHSMEPNPLIIAAVLFPGLFLVAVVWSVMNWYLSIAVLFADKGTGIFRAVKNALRFTRANRPELAQIAVASGAIRLAWFVLVAIVSLALILALAKAAVVPVIGLLVLITLIYFAVSDIFYLARLCAYLYLLKADQQQQAMTSSV